MSEKLLEVKDLKTYFPIQNGLFGRSTKYVKAVDGVSFDVYKGETLGLVGESGCGKSTTGRSIMRLIEPTEGKIIFDGKDISSLNKKQMLKIRREMQMIFQDPFSSLNPRKMVKEIIGAAFEIHMSSMRKKEREEEVAKLLEVVGLNPDYITRYPHEFSGGQRQRIGIARSLALKPKLIIADEPVSALDVSIQSQVLNLLNKLQKQFSLTYIFIAHDLSVVRHLSDRVGVMYLGKIVELTDANRLYTKPAHPYTKALLSAIPIPEIGVKRERIILEGDVPSPINPPNGCRFHTRCPKCMDICKEKEPDFKDIGDKHYVACHLVNG
ncbi:ABC transporter ATP-binding protein [Paramaledivibacter caminithermalis]|uniref:Oligopeptide transport system ATP-binding protein n=1 Tax=Paramaledivibacter caminithermalis (strain DSM 15212 / CIP 107654 / DViRD3) TaxID=1121301 RepID=A0A1M6PVG4_PARC5|nr:dipeptide ABC transporter ATP-binding protein [Paramaledivibacter caminithermalis]SHK11911.1 oligopeptide transport system ATP-binding protein [Paramaledivibacter caminithermalis DSM 15212]